MSQTVETPTPLNPPPPLTLRTTSDASIETGQSSPEVASPTSSESSLSLDNTLSFEPEVLRRGDPDWVARPRNPFIIFRCIYSRENTRGGKRIRRPAGSTNTEKTLSKRAAEAWHKLTKEEKDRFKELADLEKEEHARLHPNYRFRPAKRGTGKKKGFSSRSNSLSLPLSRIATSLTSSVQSSPVTLSPLPLPTAPLPPVAPASPADISTVKAGRRRSASVPSLFPYGTQPFILEDWASLYPKLSMKRSRSALGNRPPSLSMSNVMEGTSFDPRMLEQTSDYNAYRESSGTIQRRSSGSFFFADDFATSALGPTMSQRVQPSSLSGYESDVCGSDPTSPWSTSSFGQPQPLQSQGSFNSEHSISSVDAVFDGNLVNHLQEDQWLVPAAEYSYAAAMHTSLGLDSSGSLFSPTSVYQASGNAAAIEPNQVLDPRAIENPEEAMYALNLNDYLNYSQ
ncbi:hypothetical protein H0H93_006061 [Arthromyces matolae]|nr:hypothetical protein H0H93_006061 [Arthromyces matolae]